MQKKTINFATALYVKGKLPRYYTKVVNNLSDNPIFKNSTNGVEDLDVLVVEDLPRYFTISRNQLPEHLKSILVKTYLGFLINFKGVKIMPEYPNKRFGRTSKYKLKRDQKKVRTLF